MTTRTVHIEVGREILLPLEATVTRESDGRLTVDMVELEKATLVEQAKAAFHQGDDDVRAVAFQVFQEGDTPERSEPTLHQGNRSD